MERLSNQLKWKVNVVFLGYIHLRDSKRDCVMNFFQEEQMEDMNELATRNTELQARVDMLMREKTEREAVGFARNARVLLICYC